MATGQDVGDSQKSGVEDLQQQEEEEEAACTVGLRTREGQRRTEKRRHCRRRYRPADSLSSSLHL